MNNDYVHLTLHHQHVHEALQRAENARHAAELPKPPRRDFPGWILDLFRLGRRPETTHHATMAV